MRRFFTTPGVHPFDAVEWELRDARIGHGDRVAFEQQNVEFPKSWSQNATNIVAQKYFRGQIGHPARERSVKQMIGRVAGTITGWGRERGYFASDEDAEIFEHELTHILLHQMAAFNSPVWFNVGFEESPQCQRACLSRARLDPEGMVPIGELVEGDRSAATVYDANGEPRGRRRQGQRPQAGMAGQACATAASSKRRPTTSSRRLPSVATQPRMAAGRPAQRRDAHAPASAPREGRPTPCA